MDENLLDIVEEHIRHVRSNWIDWSVGYQLKMLWLILGLTAVKLFAKYVDKKT